MVEPDVVETRLRANLPDVVHLEIEDLTGTRDHYRATVVCAGFAGKSRVERQRMVYSAMGDLMRERVHALTIRATAPGEK